MKITVSEQELHYLLGALRLVIERLRTPDQASPSPQDQSEELAQRLEDLRNRLVRREGIENG